MDVMSPVKKSPMPKLQNRKQTQELNIRDTQGLHVLSFYEDIAVDMEKPVKKKTAV